MCGIIYISRKEHNANKMLIKRYLRQKARGSDGFGFVDIGNRIKVKRATTEKDIFNLLNKTTSKNILFHHRFPTSTPNYTEMAHPIKVENKMLDYNYLVVHNGIITNASEMKKKHVEIGFEYNTGMVKKIFTKKNVYIKAEKFNDSESLAIELALYLENKKNKIEAEGSMAFVVVQSHKNGIPKNLFYGRNSLNPLTLSQKNDFFVLSSEGGESIDKNMLFKKDLKTDKITSEKITLNAYPDYDFYDDGYNYHKYHNFKNNYVYPDTTPIDYEKVNNLSCEIYDLQQELAQLKETKDDDGLIEMVEAEIESLSKELKNLELKNLNEFYYH